MTLTLPTTTAMSRPTGSCSGRFMTKGSPTRGTPFSLTAPRTAPASAPTNSTSPVAIATSLTPRLQFSLKLSKTRSLSRFSAPSPFLSTSSPGPPRPGRFLPTRPSASARTSNTSASFRRIPTRGQRPSMSSRRILSAPGSRATRFPSGRWTAPSRAVNWSASAISS